MKALLHRHRGCASGPWTRWRSPWGWRRTASPTGPPPTTATVTSSRSPRNCTRACRATPSGPRTRGPAPPVPRVRAGWLLLTLLPGALGAVTVTGLRLAQGTPRLLVSVGGLLAVALATRAALRHGPLAGPPGTRAWRTAPGTRAGRTPPHTHAGRTTVGTRAWTLWLLGYALLGDGLLHAVLSGGPDAPPTGAPDGPWPTATAPALALLLACAPAAWCAHLLAAAPTAGSPAAGP
ncbi:hypothetical protein ACFQ3Z_30470 [Streptomyces nogalater]